ncbi:MAG: NifB/NifX family molybdenum-iron cluster-binding protein [Formivibrio sp.]|nr:NifB/NifX family molybdenum-iron cluster-binding protein [Formivibrio sp.]
MKLCIPVQENIGLQAAMEPHFPHADTLLVFDTESRQYHYIDVNASEAVSAEQSAVDAVLCGSINRHTLRSLLDQRIQVFGTDAQTAIEAITQFENGALEAVTIAALHGQGGCDCHGEGAAEAHECCGGQNHADKEHECCGGHGHEGEDHECCGGQSHGKGHCHNHAPG